MANTKQHDRLRQVGRVCQWKNGKALYLSPFSDTLFLPFEGAQAGRLDRRKWTGNRPLHSQPMPEGLEGPVPAGVVRGTNPISRWRKQGPKGERPLSYRVLALRPQPSCRRGAGHGVSWEVGWSSNPGCSLGSGLSGRMASRRGLAQVMWDVEPTGDQGLPALPPASWPQTPKEPF